MRPQVVLSGRALATGVAIAYLLMFAAGTSHVCPRTHREVVAVECVVDMVLRVQGSSAVCDLRNVVIGDSAVRTGSHCVTEENEAKHEREKN